MESLRAYLKTLSVAEQAAYAVRAGTTIGYLRKALSLGTLLREKQCAALERESDGAVTRRDLRPDDWQLIWPELADHPPNQPPALASQAPAAIDSEVEEGANA